MLHSPKDAAFVMQVDFEYRWITEKYSWNEDSIVWRNIDLLRDHIRYHICTNTVINNNADLECVLSIIREQIIECRDTTYLYFRNREDGDTQPKIPTHVTITNIPLHKLIDNV